MLRVLKAHFKNLERLLDYLLKRFVKSSPYFDDLLDRVLKGKEDHALEHIDSLMFII